MAERGRGLVIQIFKNFWESLQRRQLTGNKIGTDYFGNTYFEIPPDPRRGKRNPQRWFTPKDPEAFDQELPAEWESWLRGRREIPPQDEEILKNLTLVDTKRKNYAKLQAEYGVNKTPMVAELPKTGYESFPKYDDYELSPGESANKRRK